MTTPVSGRIRSIDAVLTAECNLRCQYCYQSAKGSRHMSWDTLRAALDLGLESKARTVEFAFMGGEPLLELSLVRQAVVYVRNSSGAGQRFHFYLGTNGILLDAATAAFLETHRIHVQLSCDGVASAQEQRAPGTFAQIEALLDRLRSENREFFTHYLTLSLTVTPSTLVHLPASIEYFMNREVRNIALGPDLTATPAWSTGRKEELEDAFRQVEDISRLHLKRTGRVPLVLLRRRHRPQSPRACRMICAAAGGESLTVDTDGNLYGCVMFAGSYQDLGGSPLRERLPALCLGSIHAPGLAERLAAYPAAARRTGLFHRKELKYTSYGRCGDCRWRDRCLVCPATAFHIPGNACPHRVSDFCCAFNQVARRYQERFPPLPNLPERLRRLSARRRRGGGRSSRPGSTDGQGETNCP